MTRRGGGRGRGQSGDNFGYQRDNNFGGNRRGKQNHFRGDRNEFSGGNDRPNYSRDREDTNAGGFRKFRGTNSMSPRGRRNNFKSRNYNNRNNWAQNEWMDENHFSGAKEPQNEKRNEEHLNMLEELDKSSEQPFQKNESLQFKSRTETTEHQTSTPKQKNKTRRIKTEPPSNSGSSEDEEDAQTTKTKTNGVVTPILNIKVKKEQVDKVRVEKKEVISKPPPPAPRPADPPASSDASSSESSESSSSEEEDEEPEMPQPIASEIKPKKEKKSEDDVVCLGKLSNNETVDDTDSRDPTTCMVCSKPGHSADECQMKCRKCSHSSYQCQMVCKNCGETYTNGVKSLPKPPNPFMMFMQFMQFCMSQYSDMFTDIKYPFPPCENTVHCPEPPPTAEVSRKDIENSKNNRKRTKSETKQSRKKSRKNSVKSTDDDSDSSSKVASSTKKRKKGAKSITRETETPPVAMQQQPFGQHFGPSYPSNLPFGGTYSAPGFNPMMAFNQMMGYNPAAMSFSR